MSDATAAVAMRKLPEALRDELIAASDDVLGGRSRFSDRRQQAELQRAYRKPQGGGVA